MGPQPRRPDVPFRTSAAGTCIGLAVAAQEIACSASPCIRQGNEGVPCKFAETRVPTEPRPSSFVVLYRTAQPDIAVQDTEGSLHNELRVVDIMKWGMVSVFVGGLAVGACAWMVLAVESIRAILSLKPEARQHRYVRWNWLNALPRSELFTTKGLVHRRRAFLALLWFLGAVAVCGTSAVTAVALRRYGS